MPTLPDWSARRPENGALNATRERLRKVMDTVDDIKTAITALEENRLDDARRGISQLYQHEEEAEQLRRSITHQLATGVLPANVREELEYVLRQLDTIADFFRSAARQISSILQIKLPKKPATATVELIGVVKDYMLGKVPVKALCGVDLKVDKEDFLAILGPSGSGKSTLLNMIGLLDRPTEGTVKIEGINTATLSDRQRVDVRRRVGFVFQFFNLIPRLSARENVELPMAISNLSRTERRVKAEELLTIVGLGDRMNHKPSELSGGERQRVAIARALSNDPHFLLLDEPTGNIDSKTAVEILELVSRLNREQGVTILMITHDANIAKYAKRTVHLLDGRIVKEGN